MSIRAKRLRAKRLRAKRLRAKRLPCETSIRTKRLLAYQGQFNLVGHSSNINPSKLGKLCTNTLLKKKTL